MDDKSKMLLKLQAMKKELAVKSKKLERSKGGARVRAYVRQKIKEHNELENNVSTPCQTAVMSSSDLKQHNDRTAGSQGRKSGEGNKFIFSNEEFVVGSDNLRKGRNENISELSFPPIDSTLEEGDKTSLCRLEINSTQEDCKCACDNNKKTDRGIEKRKCGSNTFIRPEQNSIKKMKLSLVHANVSNSIGLKNTSQVFSSSSKSCVGNLKIQENSSIFETGSKAFSEDLIPCTVPTVSQQKESLKSSIRTASKLSCGYRRKQSNFCRKTQKKDIDILVHDNQCPKSDIFVSEICDEAIFFTPSIQSKACRERFENDSFKNRTSQFSRAHSNNISNSDFLCNVLGISQLSKDVQSECDSHSIMDNIDIKKQFNSCDKETVGKSLRKLSKAENTDCIELQLQCKGSDVNISSKRDSTSNIEYTELDVIPYSQFELTEDFLSETSHLHNKSNGNKGRYKQSGYLIKRKSPRLSSNFFSCARQNAHNSNSDNQNSCDIDSLSQYKRRKQSLSVPKKAIAVMSIFQLMIDEAKKNKCFQEFQLLPPGEFYHLMKAKTDSLSSATNKDVEMVLIKHDSMNERHENLNAKGSDGICVSVKQPLVISEDNVFVREHHISLEMDNSSLIQSSFHALTNLKENTDDKMNKDIVCHSKDFTTSQFMSSQISCHHSKERKSPEKNLSQFNNDNFFEKSGSSAKTKLKVIIKEGAVLSDHECNDVVVSSLVDNCNSSQCFMSPVTSSSTPKCNKLTRKPLPMNNAPSPIVQSLKSRFDIDDRRKGVEQSHTFRPSPYYKNTSQPSLSLTSTPKQQVCTFSPIEKSVNIVDLHDSICSEEDGVYFASVVEKIEEQGEPPNIARCDDGSTSNSSSKTESRFKIQEDIDSIMCRTFEKEDDISVSSTPTNKPLVRLMKRNCFEMSGGKSPLSRYLEESVLVTEKEHVTEKDLLLSVLVSPDQKIPKTSSTPLQVFEKSCTISGALLSPIFTPSRTSRARCEAKNSKKRNNNSQQAKTTLKFDGCFQSCSEDAVVHLLHGQLFVDQEGWKRYLVSIQASALTVWIQNSDGNDWIPELDWRLSAEIHVLHACLLAVTNKIAVAASGWEKKELFVTVFVYDFSDGNTFRFNISDVGKFKLRTTQIHLCPCPSSHLLLGITSDTSHTIRKVTFQKSIQNVASCKDFDTLQGKLNTVTLCQGQDGCCVSLTWDQRITLWNTLCGVALRTISLPSNLPCLTALVSAKTIKGLMLLTVSWRVDEIDDCGGIICFNPMTGHVYTLTRWSIPNTGWRSSEKTKIERNLICAVSSSGSVSWWNGSSGQLVGCRPSNVATCVSAMENRHLIIGEMHGCVHLYSLC